MIEVGTYLYRTRKNLKDAATAFGRPVESFIDLPVEPCASCNLWLFPRELTDDLDGHPVCKECLLYYGM